MDNPIISSATVTSFKTAWNRVRREAKVSGVRIDRQNSDGYSCRGCRPRRPAHRTACDKLTKPLEIGEAYYDFHYDRSKIERSLSC